MAAHLPKIENWLRRAEQGSDSALEQVLEYYRPRLRKMVAVHLDARLARRLDPSDLVQETLLHAAQKLPAYFEQRPVPFYPWLRSIAVDRLIDLQRRHVGAQKRSVLREEPGRLELSDQSVLTLAQRLFAKASSPSEQMQRKHRQALVRRALDRLETEQRELLVLRYLEELPAGEVAQMLGLAERTYRRRHRQALLRLSELLQDSSRQDPNTPGEETGENHANR